MKRSLSRQIKWNYLALAFALPVLGILVMQKK
jgi:hypothetical protein